MLLQSIRTFIQRQALLDHGQSLVVGVSGGPDSLTLLHLLTRLREEFDLQLRAVHLNHQLRAAAEADAEYVAQICAAWGVPCDVERMDIAAFAHAHKLSLEEAGRRARYELFAKFWQTVAVAHNADDQAETVLMHFLRGSGLGGLRGMLPKARNQWAADSGQYIIRPLLNITRKEIEAYCVQHNLQPRLDETNTDTTYYRNRLRHELLPALETYNPNIREILGRTAEVSAGDFELLRDVVHRAWADVVIAPVGTELVAFDLAKWRQQPVPLQRALLREAITRLRADLRDVDFAPIENAVRWLQTARSGQMADLMAGLCVRVTGSMLKVGEWRVWRGQPLPVPAVVPVGDGNTVYSFARWQIKVEFLDHWLLSEIETNTDQAVAYVDAALAPFVLRARRAGDRFAPLGMEGRTMKLSDLMINQKIPLEDRDCWPLLVGDEIVLWVCGLRMAQQARVGMQTERVLKLMLTEKK